MSQAIATLAAEGLVVSRPGSGTYVAARAQRRAKVADTAWQTVALTDRTVDTRILTGAVGAPPAGTIMLDGGYLHRSLQPTQILTAALARAARRPDAWDRAPAGGLAALRSVFATMAGGGVTADDILVTAGGQSALSMAFRAIAAPGDPILMESPTYPGAIAAARAAGLRPVPVPMDADGLQPDLLADAFAMTRARLLYCQPAYHNPTGTVLAPQRRRQIIDAARAAGAFVIEDDFARHLGHGTPVPPPLLTDDLDGTVVYLTSLTKPAAPSLRIGALVARGPVMERLRATRLVDDFFVTRPLQETALELLSSTTWERHVRSWPRPCGSGAERWRPPSRTKLPTGPSPASPQADCTCGPASRYGTDDTVIADAARQHGVAVSAGHRYFATELPAAYLRLGFAATADRTELIEAARRLASAHEHAAGAH